MTIHRSTAALANLVKQGRPVRVVICSYESAYTDAFLKEFAKSPRVQIVGLVQSTSLSKGKRSSLADDFHLLRKTGVFYSLYLWFATSGLLRQLKVTRWLSMKQWAKNLVCPLLPTADINESSAQKALNELAPDLIVSAHFNQIYSAAFIENTQCALWNIHPSLLPDHRGLDPAFYVLLNEEQETGVTLHEISPAIDEGQILDQTTHKVETHVLHRLNLQLFAKGGTLLSDYLEQLPVEKNMYFTTMPSNTRYNSWPSFRNYLRFIKSGKGLIW